MPKPNPDEMEMDTVDVDAEESLDEFTPEEQAVLDEGTEETQAIPEPEPDTPVKETQQTGEQETDAEQDALEDLRREMRRLKRENGRMVKRLERLQTPPAQAERPQPTQPVSIPQEKLAYDDNGNFAVDPAVLEQLLAPPPNQAADLLAQQQRIAMQQQMLAEQQKYAQVRDEIIDEDPDRLAPVVDKLEKASEWMLRTLDAEAKAYNVALRGRDDLERFIKEIGFDEDFADTHPDIELADLLDAQFEPNVRKHRLRRLVHKYAPESDASSDTADLLDVKEDDRLANRRRVLDKPRSMAKKGTTKPEADTKWSVEKLAELSEPQLLRVLATNKVARELWDSVDAAI